MSLKTFLDEAGRGSVTKLSSDLRVPVSLISQWANGTRPIPAERCPDIESATGVPCEELRPDVNWAVLRGPADDVAVNAKESA